MKVIGIDPGMRVSGYAVVEQVASQLRIVDAGVIRSDADLPLSKRLDQIYQDFDAILSEHNPEVLSIEELYAHYKHPRTAILMGHARGVFLVTAAQHLLEVKDYAATRIKKSLTGNGRASKEQIQRAIQTQLALATLPEPADVADALAIALCCLNEYQREQLIKSTL